MSIERMKAVMAEMKDLSGKAAEEKDEAKKAVLQDMIAGKKADFAALEIAAKDEQEQAEREKLMADLEAKRGAANTEKKDAMVEIDGKSEHNQTNHDMDHTQAFCEYFTAKSSGSAALANIAGKKGDQFVDSLKPADGKGILMPKWMIEYVAPQATAMNDVQATLGKSLDQIHGKDILVREASGTNAGGGSLVNVDYETTLFKTPKRLDDLASRCWVKRAVGKEAQFPKLTQSSNEFGVAATWGTGGATNGEGTALTESNPVFTRVDVNLERLSCLSQASLREVRVNDVGLEAELAWMFRGAASRQISRAILQGVNTSGTAELANAPTGINTAGSITAGVGTVGRQTAAQVSYTDLVNLQFTVDDGVFGDGIYVVSAGSTGAMKYIAGLDDASGRPVFAPENTWGNGRPATIAGEEYISTVANNKALGARGDVVYGNFMAYGLVLDNEFAIERSDEYAFNTGVVTYRMIMYVGGQPLGYDQFAVLDDVAGVSSSSSSA